MSFNMSAAVNINATVTGGPQVDQLNEKLRKLAQQSGTSVGQINAAFRSLPAQLTDVATQLAGGQNPLLILLQQGGQIKDQFGGIGTTFRALASVATPARLAMLGVGGALATAGAAAFAGQKEFSAFQKTLALTGQTAGVTYGQFVEMSRAISQATGATVGATKDLLQGALATGEFGPGSIRVVTEAMAKLQYLSGATADEVVKDFASMSRGVAAWAAEHNRRYAFLTLEQYKYIRTLEQQGRTEEAVAETAKRLNEALSKRTVDLGYLETAWKNVASWASKAWDAMLNVGRPDTLQQQIATLQEQLAKVENPQRVAGRMTPPVNQGLAERLRKEIAILQERADAEKKVADAQADRAQKEKKLIADEASGLNKKLEWGAIDRDLIRAQMEADEALVTIQKNQALLKAERDKALMSESEYVRRSTELKQQQLDVEIQVAEKRLQSIRGRSPGDRAAEDQRRTEILKAEAEIAKLRAQRDLEGATGRIEAGAADYKQSKALQEFIKQLEHQNELVRLEGEQVYMTDFAYKQLVATKQHEYDIAQKTKDMSAGEAAAYRAAADAAFKLKLELEGVNYQQSRTFEFGARSAIKTYLDEISNAGKQTEQLFTNAFKSMEDAIVQFSMTGKLNFKSLANSIIQDLIRMTVRMMIMRPLMGAFGGLFGFGGGAATPMAGTASISNFAAMGGVYGAAQAFAAGGVVNRPTSFMFANGGTLRNGIMGEAGPEAILPLQRTAGGKLGVLASGNNGGGDTSVVVNVNVESGSEQVNTNDGASALGRVIAGAVRSELINQKRPGGLLAA